ncbi:MAG: 50S ribosomal protein L24 [Candidatus Doudnabacteria bacterium]|nr:50S ribosomal protein L24 [Candidatus Doudnabacteria bacterium]
MHIRKGDTVKILTGRDRGQTGKVLAVDPGTGRATVEGRNLFFRHERPKKQGQKGQRVQLPGRISLGKLMLVCPHCKKAARVGRVTDDKGIKTRICKNCGKSIA